MHIYTHMIIEVGLVSLTCSLNAKNTSTIPNKIDLLSIAYELCLILILLFKFTAIALTGNYKYIIRPNTLNKYTLLMEYTRLAHSKVKLYAK